MWSVLEVSSKLLFRYPSSQNKPYSLTPLTSFRFGGHCFAHVRGSPCESFSPGPIRYEVRFVCPSESFFWPIILGQSSFSSALSLGAICPPFFDGDFLPSQRPFVEQVCTILLILSLTTVRFRFGTPLRPFGDTDLGLHLGLLTSTLGWYFLSARAFLDQGSEFGEPTFSLFTPLLDTLLLGVRTSLTCTFALHSLSIGHFQPMPSPSSLFKINTLLFLLGVYFFW